MHALFTLLVLAVLANGSYFWLQKSQVLPSSTYEAYLGAVQHAHESNAQEYPRLEREGFYAVPKPWIFTKLLKDIFILAFAAFSAVLLRRSNPLISADLILLALLGLVLVAAFLHSLQSYGAWVAVTGLRPIAYLAGGLIGLWAVSRNSLELLCRYLVAVLVMELILALYEYRYGIPLFSTARLGNRVAGTFSFPTSLGIFAITVCTLAFSFSQINKLVLAALAIAFVYLTGSATALVLLLVGLAMWAIHAAPARWKTAARLTSVGILAAAIVTLPSLVARYDVFNSLWGRIEPATDYIEHRPSTAAVLFGKGLGIGSNIVNSAIAQSNRLTEPEGIDLYHARADSTPLALINQIGVVGALLFYLTAGVAAWRDRRALPALVIILLAGMTVNLLELFPVNFLLGLLLCRGLLSGAR